MNAVISGQAGVAVLVDGPRLASIHAGGDGDVVGRRPEEVRFLLGDARDLEFVEDIEPGEVSRRLEIATSRYDALHLALILLDETLSPETRRCAAEELEELLENPEVGSFPEHVLHAHPLPRGADPAGAAEACTHRTPRARSLLQQLVSLQPVVHEIYGAWDSIPTEVFGAEQDRAHALATAVREGLFRDLVVHRADQASTESLLSIGLAKPAWSKVKNGSAILRGWISALQRDVEQGIGKGRARPRRYRYLSLEELQRALRHPRGGGGTLRPIVRHLLAGCDRCREDLEALLDRPLDYDYDEAFASAEHALAEVFAEGIPPEAPPETLLQELLALPEGDQVRQAGSEGRFAHPSFVKQLIETSHGVRYEDPARSLHYAHLACLAAEFCTVKVVGSPSKLADLRAQGWRQYGNALRVQGRLSEAEAAFARAKRFLEEGTKDPLLRAQVCEKVASLRMSQRRFAEAIEMAAEAGQFYSEIEDKHAFASTLIQKAIASLYSGESEEAVHTLNRAIPLIDADRDPQLLLAACHNLVRCYIDLDRPEEALAIYFDVRDLYTRSSNPDIRLRVAWQEGLLLRDLGYLRAAEGILSQTRDGLVERQLMYEAALISLDLASVYVKLQKRGKVEQVIAETVPIFRALGVDREAIASLLQLQQVPSESEQTIELIQVLNAQLVSTTKNLQKKPKW